MTEEFMFLDLALIEPSRTNPRKTFDAAKLQELATSIKAIGLHQPVVVRPLPASRVADTSIDPATGKPRKVRPTYELVCGERRYRASKLAGKDDISALIRDLTDDQVMEIQIVENLQRDDLSELEEAEGYEQLMKHSGLTADQVGEKIGKSRSYVYARLKLLDLSVECKTAMRAGQIDASRALLIARIPDSKLQLKALEYAVKPIGWDVQPPSVRALQNWLRDNVMLKLEHAIFKITDVRLVEAAGSCPDCPKRTGANPDLFADVDGADICTDPACYHGKEEAHRAQLVKKAEAKGMRIVQDKEALELLDGNQYRTTPDGYTGLSNQRLDLSTEGERPITLGQALGKDAPSPILFIHPKTQQISELVPEDEAEAVLLAKGLIKVADQRAGKQQDLDEELELLQRRVKMETDKAAAKALQLATMEAIRKTTTAQAKQLLTGEVLRAYLLGELDYIGEQDMARICGYEFAEGVDEMDAITAHLQRMGDTDLIRTTALSFLDREPHSTINFPRDAFVKALDINTKAVTKEANATVKAEYAARIKAVQDQIDAQKAPPPNAPLAQPKNAGGDKSKRVKGSKAPAKNAPAARANLSAEEALSGIATAMQGVDRAASAPDGAVAPPEATNADTQLVPVEAWPFPGTDTAKALAAKRQELGLSVPVDQRVKVVLGKYKGKEGTVKKDMGSDIYLVKIDRVSVASSMSRKYFELVEAVAA